jgi:hypothetical protein
MPSVVDGHLADIGQPHHHMSCARAYFVVAARATIRLERSRAGYRPNLVLVSVWPGLHATRSWHRRMPTR